MNIKYSDKILKVDNRQIYISKNQLGYGLHTTKIYEIMLQILQNNDIGNGEKTERNTMLVKPSKY